MEKNIALWYMLLIAFAAGISTSTVKSTLAMVKIRQTLLERV
jgi:predicted histidine transporter YuiF (NhaC family)